MKTKWCIPCRKSINRYQRAYRRAKKADKPLRAKRKLCSKCRKLWTKQYVKPTRTADPEAYRKYQRKYRRKYRAEGRDRWINRQRRVA